MITKWHQEIQIELSPEQIEKRIKVLEKHILMNCDLIQCTKECHRNYSYRRTSLSVAGTDVVVVVVVFVVVVLVVVVGGSSPLISKGPRKRGRKSLKKD